MQYCFLTAVWLYLALVASILGIVVHTNALFCNKIYWYYCIANNEDKKATQCDDPSVDCQVGILTNALLNLIHLLMRLWNDLVHFFSVHKWSWCCTLQRQKKKDRKNWTPQRFWTKRIQICKGKSYKKSTNVNNVFVQCCISQHYKFDQKFTIVIHNIIMPVTEGQTLLDKAMTLPWT